MYETKLSAWWFHRQGLDGTITTQSPAEVLERAGWARSVAGSGPYLTFFSRPGISRESVDAAVAQLAIHELPSARRALMLFRRRILLSHSALLWNSQAANWRSPVNLA